MTKDEAIAQMFANRAKVLENESGIGLRDYFAANALQGLMANKSNPLHFNPEDDSAYVYRIADAMLAERDKENNDAAR